MSSSPPPLIQARSPLTGKSIQAKLRHSAVRSTKRTQAERVAETRAKIIAATVTYIDERGFHQASLQQVAKAAHVTVGAVQHHFANKTELLDAVVEDSFDQLTQQMSQLDFQQAELKTRIALFVDHSWQFCNSAQFQASLQILLGVRAQHDDFEQWINETLGQVASEGIELWLKVFDDLYFSEAEHFDTLLYIFSSLSGSAMMHRISQSAERVDSDLNQLKHLLLLKFNEASKT